MNHMSNETSNESDFINEKVIGRDENRQKVKKSAVYGAVFGLAAALTFSLGVLVLHGISGSGSGTRAETSEASSTEATEAPASTEEAGLSLTEKELKAYINKVLEEHDRQAEKTEETESSLEKNIKKSLSEVNDAMAVVTAVKTDTDWFDNSYSSKYQQTGMLIREDQDKYYILTGYSRVRSADSIEVQLSGGESMEAQLEGYDNAFDAAILSIAKKKLGKNQQDTVRILETAEFSRLERGSAVMVCGSPDGSVGSVASGFITNIVSDISLTDAVTDAVQSSVAVNGTGYSFLCDMNGRLIGVYTGSGQEVSKGYSQAYSIESLEESLELIYAGKRTAALGIIGQDIPSAVRARQEIPDGIYVMEVADGSAAYEAGIHAGDIVTAVDKYDIASMDDYLQALGRITPGTETGVTIMRKTQDAYSETELELKPRTRQN